MPQLCLQLGVELPQRNLHVFGHRQRREQRAALEQHAPALADILRIGLLAADHRLAEHLDLAGFGSLKADDRAHQHRLAGARAANHADDLAAIDTEVEALVDDLLAKRVLEPAHLDDACGVEPVRRLVEDQDLGILEERPGDPQTLLHPERVRLDLVVRPLRETDLLQGLGDAGAADARDPPEQLEVAPRHLVERHHRSAPLDARRAQVQRPARLELLDVRHERARGLDQRAVALLEAEPVERAHAEAALERLLARTRNLPLAALVGLPVALDGLLYNCAALICRGRLVGVVPKSYLPNYREFYERRQFTPGEVSQRSEIELAGQRTAFGAALLFKCNEMPGFVLHVEICEDLWVPVPPSSFGALAGAAMLLAAVLGIIITMGHLDAGPEVIGHHVGAALVGTFLGVLTFALIFSLMTQLDLSTEIQQVTKGAIVLGAVLIQRPEARY